MIAQLTKQVYMYQSIELSNGYKASADEVIVKNNKLQEINCGFIFTSEEEAFTFSLYVYSDGRQVYSLNAAPENVDAQAIIQEFISFIKNDINI